MSKSPKVEESESSSENKKTFLELVRQQIKLTENEQEKIHGEFLQKDAQEMLENDLSCAICQDIYINPLILNCSHSFCKFCVYRWLTKNKKCPQCRMAVTFQAENLALRNIINKMVQKSSEQFQKNRKNNVDQRLKDEEEQEKDSKQKLLKYKNTPFNNRSNNNNNSNGIDRTNEIRALQLFFGDSQPIRLPSRSVENQESDDENNDEEQDEEGQEEDDDEEDNNETDDHSSDNDWEIEEELNVDEDDDEEEDGGSNRDDTFELDTDESISGSPNASDDEYIREDINHNVHVFNEINYEDMETSDDEYYFLRPSPFFSDTDSEEIIDTSEDADSDDDSDDDVDDDDNDDDDDDDDSDIEINDWSSHRSRNRVFTISDDSTDDSMDTEQYSNDTTIEYGTSDDSG